MPATDEDIVRDLLHRYTDHVRPPASIAAEVAACQRRQDRRRRVVSVAAAGAAIGTAAGLVAVARAFVARSRRAAACDQADSRPARALPPQFRRGRAAAGPGPLRGAEHGRRRREGHLGHQQPQREHVVLSAGQRRLTVRQELLPALLTDVRPVRGHADQPCRPARRSHRAVEPADQAGPRPVRSGGPTPVPLPLTVSDNDKVFQQASDLLWNPLVGPALRAALYKVLAAVPGVTVTTSAHDSIGRPAVEISRADTSGLPGGKPDGISYATYESPATGAVLESTVTYPPGSDIVTSQDPHGTRTVVDVTVYLTLTWASAIPADPYGS